MEVTHWKDDRGLVITDQLRTERGEDYAYFYTTPCRKAGNGRIVPLYPCTDCKKTGRDKQGDHCEVCGGSGGLTKAPTGGKEDREK